MIRFLMKMLCKRYSRNVKNREFYGSLMLYVFLTGVTSVHPFREYPPNREEEREKNRLFRGSSVNLGNELKLAKPFDTKGYAKDCKLQYKSLIISSLKSNGGEGGIRTPGTV